MSLSISDLNTRSLDVFRELIETFIETGEPVGSRTISRRLAHPLSAATIRNVMADLEEVGLLYAPHTSAGRLPTEAGLRFFVDGLLEVGDIQPQERQEIERRCKSRGVQLDHVLEEASTLLSGLSCCAGLVMTPKMDAPLRQIEFMHLAKGRVLAILIAMDGTIENRVLEMPDDMTISQPVLTEAAYYISARVYGRTLEEARSVIEEELLDKNDQLSHLASKVIQMGIGVWTDEDPSSRSLIVKGQSNLLDTVTELQDLNHIRSLFHVLDTKDTLLKLLDSSIQAEGVKIFIGSENSSFQVAGCSMVVAPYRNTDQKIIGAIGVIGPSRMNYSRIIPLVDYTAQIIGKMISGGNGGD